MIRGSFLVRRVNYSRLLLATVMLTVLATAALGAALASFAAQSLPQAVRGQLARSPALSIAVRGAITAPQVGPAGQIVRTGIARALAGVSDRLDQGLWSDPLGQIQARAVLTAGSWPAPPRRGHPLGIALPAAAALQLRARPGTILRSR